MSARPWHDPASRAAVPTGMVVPDLSVKRSLVLERWNAQRQAERGAAVQRERLQQQARAYEGAQINRLTNDWSAMNTSADSELLTSLRVLRDRSRQLVRDNPYAKHAVRVITNNVIGTGIGMQAQVVNGRGKLQSKINDSIEEAWVDWCDKKTCHTAGLLSFADLERYALFQLPTSGEAIFRKVRQPFGDGAIPFALEVIEADRLLDNWQTARAPNGNAIRMGVEIDEWHRPVAYWFHPRHPGDYQFMSFEPAKFVRIPAEDIIHLYLIDRWPQSRGEPWFHTAIKDLHHTNGLEEAVVVKARAAANIVGFIRSPEPMAADDIKANRQLIDTEPGTWQRLLPGEDVAGFSAPVADPIVEPFLRYMTRKMAVGVGLSYETLSRDYTNATYSSARMALLDDRDVYRVLQGWICRNLRQEVHREWLDAAVLVGEVKVGSDYFSNPKKYQAVRYKPRGWSWIDPAKEVAAYKAAVRNGFMTQGDVIAQTSPGSDLEDTFKARRAELDLAAEHGLVFDSDPLQVNDKGQAQPLPVEEDTQGAQSDSNSGDDPANNGSADASTSDGDTNSKSEKTE